MKHTEITYRYTCDSCGKELGSGSDPSEVFVEQVQDWATTRVVDGDESMLVCFTCLGTFGRSMCIERAQRGR